MQRTNQEEFRIEKVIREKEKSFMSKGKAMIIHLTAGLMKKTLHKVSQYFPKPYEPFGRDINVKVDLSNYATKAILKKGT